MYEEGLSAALRPWLTVAGFSFQNGQAQDCNVVANAPRKSRN